MKKLKEDSNKWFRSFNIVKIIIPKLIYKFNMILNDTANKSFNTTWQIDIKINLKGSVGKN